jgi:hypothetical protein
LAKSKTDIHTAAYRVLALQPRIDTGTSTGAGAGSRMAAKAMHWQSHRHILTQLHADYLPCSHRHRNMQWGMYNTSAGADRLAPSNVNPTMSRLHAHVQQVSH